MPEAKHAKPTALFPLSIPVAEIFARSGTSGSRHKPHCSPTWTR